MKIVKSVIATIEFPVRLMSMAVYPLSKALIICLREPPFNRNTSSGDAGPFLGVSWILPRSGYSRSQEPESRRGAGSRSAARRGAALECSRRPRDVWFSDYSTQECLNRRLPGITQHNASTQRFRSVCTRTVELLTAGPFPGAACCQPAELPRYKAAPLRATLRDPAPLLAPGFWLLAPSIAASRQIRIPRG